MLVRIPAEFSSRFKAHAVKTFWVRAEMKLCRVVFLEEECFLVYQDAVVYQFRTHDVSFPNTLIAGVESDAHEIDMSSDLLGVLHTD